MTDSACPCLEGPCAVQAALAKGAPLPDFADRCTLGPMESEDLSVSDPVAGEGTAGEIESIRTRRAIRTEKE